MVQVLGWDASGTVEFNDVLCEENSATIGGGCFYGAGGGIINAGTAMLHNSAADGGSIRECSHSHLEVRRVAGIYIFSPINVGGKTSPQTR